jgi:hypothetical protein
MTGRIENWEKKRKLENFDSLIQDLRTAYQKTHFLAVFDDLRPNFWLFRFFCQAYSRYQMAQTGANCYTQKNKGKARAGILRFTFIFSTFETLIFFRSFATNYDIANPQTRAAAADGQTALSCLAAAAGFIPVEIVADRLNIG